MTLLSPLSLLLGLLLPALVLLYLLKLRRTEVLVSSTYLWRKSLEDLHANAPFQKLIRNLLMFVQLLVLAALVVALARPLLAGSLTSGQSRAILIDTSASMQATDVAPNRLEAAKAETLKIIEGMGENDQAMLIAFDRKTRILQPLTKEKASLKSALEGLEASDTEGSIREALLIASSVLRGKEAGTASILILSDGKCRGLDAPVDAGVDFKYLKVGTRGLNAGITALDAREVEGDPGHFQLFVETRRAGDIPAGTLSLFLNGGLVSSAKVAWQGDKPSGAVFEIRGGAETRLKVALDTQDDLAVDNTAWAVLAQRPRQKILLVSEGNYFLERLLATEPGVELYKTAPKDFKTPAEGEYALVVLDRWAPQDGLGAGRWLLFGILPPVDGFKTLGDMERPVILDWARANPLMRFANFSNLKVSKAQRWECPGWSQTLLESVEGPLIIQARRGRMSVAAVSFDLFQSDWPFRLSFPIFVSNAVRAMGAEGLGESRALRPGDAVAFRTATRPIPETLTAKLLPDGPESRTGFHGEDSLSFAETRRSGLYELSDGKETRAYGISLRSAWETDTTPLDEKDFVLEGGKTSAAAAVPERREAWPWLAAAVLMLFCLEWAMYHRRWI